MSVVGVIDPKRPGEDVPDNDVTAEEVVTNKHPEAGSKAVLPSDCWPQKVPHFSYEQYF